jgi:hypothetical protein
MSILDRVTKAVGDVVDRGKKEVDQFVRIQKINGQIGDFEKSIRDCENQTQQLKIQIGDIAIGILQTGSLASPEMKSLVDQINTSQQQIADLNTEINQKKSEIELIKAEGKSPIQSSPAAEPVAPAPPPPPPSVSVPPPPAAVSVPPPPPPPTAERSCPQCGAHTGTGAFCSGCGAKLP